ncbi:MAG TPA: carboxypeptidase-like regulatory domain-containing protein, partial [Gemmatimonadales bacterium]|nr:carboxypeptidase-like regulatory domain-containing protein [Gemmatimonadales bacterium]
MRSILFCTGSLVLASPLAGQATITGTIREDSSKAAVGGIEVVIPSLDRKTVTDSAGRFTITKLAHGIHSILVRSIG